MYITYQTKVLIHVAKIRSGMVMGTLYRVISRYLHVVYYISSLSAHLISSSADLLLDIVCIPDLLFFVSEGSV